MFGVDKQGLLLVELWNERGKERRKLQFWKVLILFKGIHDFALIFKFWKQSPLFAKKKYLIGWEQWSRMLDYQLTILSSVTTVVFSWPSWYLHWKLLQGLCKNRQSFLAIRKYSWTTSLCQILVGYASLIIMLHISSIGSRQTWCLTFCSKITFCGY